MTTKSRTNVILFVSLAVAAAILLGSCDDGPTRPNRHGHSHCDTVMVVDTVYVPLPVLLWVELSSKRGAQKVYVDGAFIGEAPIIFSARTNTRVRVE